MHIVPIFHMHFRVSNLLCCYYPISFQVVTCIEIIKNDFGTDIAKIYIKKSQFQNVSVCSRSRKAKILTTGIHVVFRELKFSPDAEIGQNGTF